MRNRYASYIERLKCRLTASEFCHFRLLLSDSLLQKYIREKNYAMLSSYLQIGFSTFEDRLIKEEKVEIVNDAKGAPKYALIKRGVEIFSAEDDPLGTVGCAYTRILAKGKNYQQPPRWNSTKTLSS